MEKKIILNEWLEIHPYGKTVASDKYYVEIANNILSIWETSKVPFTIPENLMKRISMYVAAYFEDVISDFGLWKTFIFKHKFLYGKWLPFYTQEEEYFEDEINLSDIKFILWYSIQELAGKATHKIFPPFMKGLDILSEYIYKYLDTQFEKAPINESIEKLFGKESICDNFYELKNILNWFFCHSYLMEPSTQAKIMQNQHFVNEQFKNATPEQKNMFMYGIMQDTIFTYPCGPLALKINDWLCAMVGKEHPNFDNYRTMEAKATLHWLVQNMTENTIVLSCITKNETLEVERNMFKDTDKYQPGKTVVTSGFVKYKGKWYISGIVSINDISVYSNVRKEPDQAQIEAIHRNVRDRFVQENNGKEIAFFGNLTELKEFLTKKMGWPEEANQQFKNLEKNRNFVVYASEDKGLMISADIAELLKHEDNPMYNAEEAKQKAFFVFVNKGQCPIDMLEYFVDNDMLQDASLITDYENNNYEKGQELVKENYDFIARMFLNEYYWN